MYLYTSEIEFAPFGSKGNRRSRTSEIVTPSAWNIPRPSPKSIYRLADKVCPLSTISVACPRHLVSDELALQYDVPALKNLAFDNIHRGLGKCDIIEESFSKFASR